MQYGEMKIHRWNSYMTCAETAEVFCDMIARNEPINLTQVGVMFAGSVDYPRKTVKEVKERKAKLAKTEVKKKKTRARRRILKELENN